MTESVRVTHRPSLGLFAVSLHGGENRIEFPTGSTFFTYLLVVSEAFPVICCFLNHKEGNWIWVLHK